MRAPCAGKWWLFDSVHPGDHLAARAICLDCPLRPQCRELVAEMRRSSTTRAAMQGTWAGTLYGANGRARVAWEDSLFTIEEARDAHRLYQRTTPEERTRSALGDRIVMGERVYQRRCWRGKQRREAVA